MRFTRRLAAVGAFGLLAVLVGSASGQFVLYQQDFEAAIPEVNQVPLTTYGVVQDVGLSGWQVQGGSGGSGISFETGIDANGVGGSQGLYGIWNHSTAADYVYSHYTVYGYPGPFPGTALNLIRVQADILVSGNRGQTPVGVVYLFPGFDSVGNPILDDMGNQIFQERTFIPRLTTGAYTHVAFTLNQATGPVPNFDFVADFSLRIEHGSDGFLFDNNNVVRIDNVLVDQITANADFDSDGDVDGNDFLRWQRGLGGAPITWTNGDADGNGAINSADLAVWKNTFGQTSPASFTATSTPEPAALAIGLAGAIGLAARALNSRHNGPLSGQSEP